ncbi:MAG: amidohydrolase family protein [Actinomycetota bacterium]
MPYTGDRVIHDADSHLMEPADWLREHAPSGWADRLPLLGVSAIGTEEGEEAPDWRALTCPLHEDPEYRADESQVLLRKNYHAVGSFERDHRAQALDQLGFRSQLVFNTWSSDVLEAAEHGDDLPLLGAMAEAHNRGMLHFCEVDERLLATAYVPLAEPMMARRVAAQAIADGAAALLVASSCPANHSPSHVDLDPVWAQAEEAGIPIVLHVGGGGELLSPRYFDNGLPPVPDFHGGAENFRSVDYVAIGNPPMQTMATLIFDGVLDRFPSLRFGVIEQGASWLPGWMRNLDAAWTAFSRNEERLRNLSARPSEIVRRQVRVTPYPHEDTGWIIANSAPEICLFSSDYPHVEGGRHPLKRFDGALDGRTDEEVRRFYADNFEDLMGAALPAPLAVGA